jgi:prepilin-type N-terminal cleavage/methylation domain-containing protein
MMRHKLGLVNKGQKGFTMLELMTAVGVSSIISVGIMMTLYQVVTGSARTGAQMTAIKQVEHAGYWVSADAQVSQNITYDDPDTLGVTEFLTLSWTDWDNAEHTVHYTLDEETGELLRDDGVNQIRVAQFLDVDPEMTNCEFADTNGDNIGDTLIFKVTAVVGDTLPETREYRIVPRPLY